MTQNRSHAVMAQRAEPHDSLDFFPTPPWATRALCEHVIDLRGARVWEPACGQGHMFEALGEYAWLVSQSDIHNHGRNLTHDFLLPFIPEGFGPFDWVITNPPFRLAVEFIERGLDVAEQGVAMLVRTAFLESVGRYERLFSRRPPSVIAQFAERVPMVKGRVSAEATTATAYCWLVWSNNPRIAPTRWGDVVGSPFIWIPPCRAALERPGDYEAPA